MTLSLIPWELECVLGDMKRAIDARLYHPSVLVALTIPEICMALALEKNVFVKQRHYVDFVEKYTTKVNLGIGAVDCYRLRGGVVHRANLVGHHLFEFTHVIFTTPETPLGLHGVTIEFFDKKALAIDVVLFCREIDAAARRWYAENEKNPKVTENIKDIIRSCPDGLHPFVKGGPIVASGQ